VGNGAGFVLYYRSHEKYLESGFGGGDTDNGDKPSVCECDEP
jgi:hypothetical protein